MSVSVLLSLMLRAHVSPNTLLALAWYRDGIATELPLLLKKLKGFAE